MKIIPTLEKFEPKYMIIDITDSLGIDGLNFVDYDPYLDTNYNYSPEIMAVTTQDVIGKTLGQLQQDICTRIANKEVMHYEEHVLGFCSLVRKDKAEFHLPQIDFVCEKNDENERKIYSLLENFTDPSGYLIDSGNSYHFQGRSLLTGSAWREFMHYLERCPIVDDRFLWVMEDRGYSALRITSSMAKPYVPRVISRIDMSMLDQTLDKFYPDLPDK